MMQVQLDHLISQTLGELKRLGLKKKRLSLTSTVSIVLLSTIVFGMERLPTNLPLWMHFYLSKKSVSITMRFLKGITGSCAELYGC